MRLRLGTPKTVLVVAPHPDDETIGCFGLMLRLRRSGVRVRVMIVSDGGASHPASRDWPRARLVRERRRESRRALRRIGIGARDAIFLDLPDGALAASHRQIARAVRRERAVHVVIAPEASDDHADHRAVATAVASMRSHGVRWLGYPVWPVAPRKPGRANLPLSPRDRLAKRSALLGYRTQAGAVRDDPNGFTMSRRQIEAFCAACEWFSERRL